MTANDEQPSASNTQERIVVGSGNALAGAGGTAVSGVQAAAHAAKARVSRTGAASAIGPYAIAVSGSLTTFQEPLPPTPYQVRTSIPSDTVKFTGRSSHVEAIVSMAGQTSGRGTVQTIDGMPGVGKSALAVHAAHQIKGLYPDRKLLIDLRGHTPGTDLVDPFDALGRLLTASGMDSRYLPATLDERVAQWRDFMAKERAILVIDNAFNSAQVAPLLPGGASTFTIVTSRRYLGDLDCDATSITLDPLTDSEALTLFRRLATRALDDSDDQVHEVAVGLAGNLPLAISILARLYANRPAWTLENLAERSQKQILTVKAESRTIAAAFDLSYDNLAPPHKSLFTLLGLHPGTEIDEPAAAALAGVSCGEAAELLDELFNLRLITEPIQDHPGRYRMHDLIRSYVRSAADKLPETRSKSALDRLYEYYETRASLADSVLTRYTRPTRVASGTTTDDSCFHDTESALAWSRVERSNLLACLDHATKANQSERVIRLTAGLAGLLRHDGPWDEAVCRHQVATYAARDLNDELRQADALLDLANALWLTGQYTESTRNLDIALHLYRSMDNRLGEANAMTEIGVVRWMEGTLSSAAEALTQGLRIYSEIGDVRGRATACNNLGVVWQLTGRYERAQKVLECAFILYESLRDELGQAHSLSNLGVVLRLTSDNQRSIETLNQALNTYRRIGNILGQGNALKELGITHRTNGKHETAIALFRSALALLRRTGNRLGEANALKNLGAARHLSGQNELASHDLEAALELYEQIGDLIGKADSMKFLGNLRTTQRDYEAADQLLTEALVLCRKVGDKPGEVEILNYQGTLYRFYRGVEASLACHEEALARAREIGSRIDEANSLLGIARCRTLVGEFVVARREFEAALVMLREIGSFDADTVAAELASLPTEGSCDPDLSLLSDPDETAARLDD